jgi:anaphase-promoting complex subunit 4
MDDSMVSEAASASDSVFSLIGSLHLPTPSRLPENACCPNKDLIIVIMGGGLKEKMLLLNLEGNKKWETEAVSDGMDRNRIMSVAWSPDGESTL